VAFPGEFPGTEGEAHGAQDLSQGRSRIYGLIASNVSPPNDFERVPLMVIEEPISISGR